MANKPRMGSDPFEKKDPLGWIDWDQTDEPTQQGNTSNPPSNPGKPSKVGN